MSTTTPTKTNVLMRSYTPNRDNVNTNETVQTPAKLIAQGIRRIYTLPLYGDARGTEGQPLVITNVMCNDGITHDLVISCTMANYVQAFDLYTGQEIWKQKVGLPITGTTAIDGWMINQHWGILGTPAIDATTQIMYALMWSSPDTTWQNGVFYFLSIYLSDGSFAATPLKVTASYSANDMTQSFVAAERKQRTAMLLQNYTNAAGNVCKTAFCAFGTISETSSTARGWVIAFDISNITKPYISAAWCSTLKYSGAGIWMGGQGLAADSDNFIYGMTGNGSFDGITDFGETVFKLQYTPPATTGAQASLNIIDWWTPWTDIAREGGDPTSTIPIEGQAELDATPMVPVPTNFRTYNDMDLGSGGCCLGETERVIYACGKDGICYPVNMDNMGKTMPADFANPAANYAKLKWPPFWFTFYPGDGISPAPQIVSDIDVLYFGKTHHQHSTPVRYVSPTHGIMIFCGGENSPIRAWKMDIGSSDVAKYLACSNEIASANCAPPGGMPGAMLTLTCEPDGSNAVLWAVMPYGNANSEITNGRLLAYDANNFITNTDGSQTLKVLWDSADWNQNAIFNKFNYVTVANGIVLWPTYAGTIEGFN